jgi:hypothetical protein
VSLRPEIFGKAMSKVLATMAVTLVLLVVFVNFSFGEVLFTENFDNQSDWQPRPGSNDASPGGFMASCDFNTVKCSWSVPDGWSYFRTTGLWWGPQYQDTIRITNLAGRGGSGKAFIVYNESNRGASMDGWGADGQLTKLLDKDYQEMFARVWVRMQAGWQWDHTNDMMIKMFRTYHFDRIGSIYNFFSGGTSAPIVLWDFKHSNTYGTRGMPSFRGDPQGTRYMMNGDSGADYLLAANSTVLPSDPGMLADGSWHSIEFHVKMNTYNTATKTWNADGMIEVWNDGELKHSRSNLLWKSTGSHPGIGWNTIGIGGNAYNLYSNPANKAEQWYAMDDVVVSTSYSGPPPKPLSVSAHGGHSTAIKVVFQPGINGTTYPLDGYRIYFGTDANKLNNSVTAPASATEVTVGDLAAGTLHYFAVTAYNKYSRDINENESLRSSTASASTAAAPSPVLPWHL